MKEKIITNLQLNLFITLGIGILGFLINKYFAEYMGLEMLGLMKLFSQMVAYLSLAELGIGTASAYALYKPLLEKNNEKINIIISTVDFFYKRVAFLIIGIGLLLSFSLKFFLDSTNYGKLLYIYWILYVLNTGLGYLFAKYSILFTANQEYRFVRKIQGTGKIIFQCLQIILLVRIKSFVLFILIMILENLYNYYFYSKHYKNNYNYIKKVKEKDKSIIKDMKNLFWHKIGSLVVYNTDYIILSKFTTLSIVGIYSSYLVVYQMLMTLINVLTPVLAPKIGTFVAKNNKNSIYYYWRELYALYILMASIIIICTYNLIFPFIKLWLGENFLLSRTTIVFILINLYINLIRGITETFKNSCGFFDDIYAPTLESGINLIFSIILVQKMGLNGVIIGTIISNVIVILLLKPFLVFKRCFEKKSYEYVLDSIKLFFLSGISMLLVNFFIRKIGLNFVSIDNWISLTIKAVLLSIISISIIFPVFILDKYFRKFVLKLIKRENLEQGNILEQIEQK